VSSSLQQNVSTFERKKPSSRPQSARRSQTEIQAYRKEAKERLEQKKIRTIQFTTTELTGGAR